MPSTAPEAAGMTLVVHVAAAVIRGEQQRILIARRPVGKHQGGLWEFPGGKVEPGESVESALARELLEELGITVEAARPLIKIRHDYPDKSVLLDVWEVTRFAGHAHGVEGQPVAWVMPEALPGYRFPEANLPIINAARLPDRYLITPEGLTPQALLEGLARALAQGVRLVQLRAPGLDEASYRELARQALVLCQGRAWLMLKGPLHWQDEFPEAGWHLTARQLREPLQRRPGGWLAASCHSEEELRLAAEAGVDFVTLSPVQSTASHPGSPALGWEQASALLQGCRLPAYLLGGLGPQMLSRALAAGAQGVAGIRSFWPA
ncbi:Nudix family hydrolase [Stutzerimonas tarimensis]|uniref:8-oxo-dGTP diphosphatase n=1 Tax=Stutzerimonas tarimensis TaxID=1507735 RepID=A0ABV7T0A7_9GAMM